jgi:hypothetical protein
MAREATTLLEDDTRGGIRADKYVDLAAESDQSLLADTVFEIRLTNG